MEGVERVARHIVAQNYYIIGDWRRKSSIILPFL